MLTITCVADVNMYCLVLEIAWCSTWLMWCLGIPENNPFSSFVYDVLKCCLQVCCVYTCLFCCHPNIFTHSVTLEVFN